MYSPTFSYLGGTGGRNYLVTPILNESSNRNILHSCFECKQIFVTVLLALFPFRLNHLSHPFFEITQSVGRVFSLRWLWVSGLSPRAKRIIASIHNLSNICKSFRLSDRIGAWLGSQLLTLYSNTLILLSGVQGGYISI
jgi:hypothetical protein